MPQIDPAGRLDTWTYEDRTAYQQQQVAKVQQLASQILPSVLSGDFTTVRQQLAEAADAATGPKPSAFLKGIGDNLKSQWEQTGPQQQDTKNYGLDFNYKINTPAPVTSSQDDDMAAKLRAGQVGFENGQRGLYDQQGDFQPIEKVQTPSFSAQLKTGVNNLLHSPIVSGNTLIRDVTGLNPENLPGPLPQITDVAASPLNLIGAGEGRAVGELGFKAALKLGVGNLLRNEAAGLGGLAAQGAANKGLDAAGVTNPAVRTAVGLGAGLAGGIGGFEAASHPQAVLQGAERAAGKVGDVAARTGIVPEGAVPFGGMIHVDQPYSDRYIQTLNDHGIEWHVSPQGTIEPDDPAAAALLADQLAGRGLADFQGTRVEGGGNVGWSPAFGSDARKLMDDAKAAARDRTAETGVGTGGMRVKTRSFLPEGSASGLADLDDAERLHELLDPNSYPGPQAEEARIPYSEGAPQPAFDILPPQERHTLDSIATDPATEKTANGRAARALLGQDDAARFVQDIVNTPGYNPRGAALQIESEIAQRGFTIGRKETNLSVRERAYRARLQELSDELTGGGVEAPAVAPTDTGAPPPIEPPTPEGGAAPPPNGGPPPPLFHDSSGALRPVPAIGSAGSDAAIAVEKLVDRAPGKLFGRLPGKVQDAIAFAGNPSLTMDRTTLNAWRARSQVRARLQTRFAATMRPYVDDIEKAIAEQPPEYHGPRLGDNYETTNVLGKAVTKKVNAAQDSLIGTAKDIADRPEMYTMSPTLRKALDAYDKAQWDDVSSLARGQYGVDVLPFSAGNKSGYVHLPTTESKDLDEAVQNYALSSGRAGTKAGAKTRVYESAWDRAGVHPDFKAETDLANLTDVHSQAMASNAANATLRRGAGGLTKTQVLEQEHPGLRTAKISAQKDLASIRGKMATVNRQLAGYRVDIKRYTAESARQSKRLENLQVRVDALGDDYGPELSDMVKQVRDLRQKVAEAKARQEEPSRNPALRNEATRRMKSANTAAANTGDKAVIKLDQAQALSAAANKAQATVSRLVKAYANAGVDNRKWTFDPTTNLYYTPDAAKTMHELMAPLGPHASAANDIIQEIRGTHLVGDISPFTIQEALGVLSSPRNMAKAVMRAIGENPRNAMARIARDEASDVDEYVQATRRPFGQSSIEFQIKGPKDYRGIGRLPIGKGRKWGDVEENMFSVVQRTSYEQWKADRDSLLKSNPGMPRAVAAHDAASVLSKVIPNLDPAERGLSPTRAMAERALLTSTSFATTPAILTADATRGMVKLLAARTLNPDTAWHSLSGREQLAIRRLTTLAASVATISATSAVLSAPSRNMSPIDALKDSLDPKSAMFMTLQLGSGRRVALGGPFRSFFKAMVPQSFNGDSYVPLGGIVNFAKSKLNSPIGVGVDIVRNKDFLDDPIRSGSSMKQLLQSLWYAGAQGIAPTALSQADQSIRSGQSPSDAAQAVGSQFLGANYTPPSATERLNQIARSRGFTSYYDAPPSVQKSIQDGNPALWQQRINQSSAASQKYHAVVDELNTGAAGRNSDVLSGAVTLKQWNSANTADGIRINQAGSDYFGQKDSGGDPKLAPYYQQITTNTNNGVTDWGAVDAWIAQQPQATQDYIRDNTGLNKAPLQKLQNSLMDTYFNIPKYSALDAQTGQAADAVVARAQALANGSTSKSVQLAMLKDPAFKDTPKAVMDAAARILLGIYKPSNVRTLWAKAHPEAILVYGDGTLTADQTAAIQKALAKQKP